jgi:hypothetical protein
VVGATAASLARSTIGVKTNLPKVLSYFLSPSDIVHLDNVYGNINLPTLGPKAVLCILSFIHAVLHRE